MPMGLYKAIFLRFLVDWLLLMGANSLWGQSLQPLRTACGGALGALYGGACLLPGMAFLQTGYWQGIFLLLTGLTGFGLARGTPGKTALYFLLQLALGGILSGLDRGATFSVMAGCGVLGLICVIGFPHGLGHKNFLPVELCYDGRRMKLIALQDTGNMLCDPVTGGPVLILDGNTAQRLTGLTEAQLRSPVESIEALPGLRLIPYRTVGTQGGLLLALQLKNVKIGTWQGSRTVAFAPESFSATGSFQALTGGML